MIDINELRQLAQDATPGPWFSDARGNIWRRPLSDLYENGGSVAGDKPIAFVFVGWRGEGVTGYPVENNARLIAAANPATISELLDRLEAAESDGLEQARLLGMSGEREAALLSKLEAAEKERDELRARIERMERQEPVGKFIQHPSNGMWEQDGYGDNPDAKPLYALPVAQPAPSVLDPKTIRDLLNESGLYAYDRKGDLAFMVAVTKFAALLAAPEAKP